MAINRLATIDLAVTVVNALRAHGSQASSCLICTKVVLYLLLSSPFQRNYKPLGIQGHTEVSSKAKIWIEVPKAKLLDHSAPSQNVQVQVEFMKFRKLSLIPFTISMIPFP